MDVNTFKEPPTITGLSTGIVSFIIFFYGLKTSAILGFILGFLIGGFFYLFLNDFMQKKKLVDIEEKKGEAVKSNIEEQRKKDLEKKTCISCAKPINSKDTACKNCGFDLQSIKV